MRSLSLLLGAALAALPRPPVADAQAAARAITLSEALAAADRNAPAIIQAMGAMRNADWGVRASSARFLPTLSLSASNTEQSPASPRVNPATGELIAGRWAVTQGYAMGLTLFNGFQRLRGLRAARAVQDAADRTLTAQRFGVALQVKQQFFASLAARESEDVARAQVVQAQRQQALTLLRVQARTATRSDSLRAGIQMGQAELALVQAANDRAVADAALTRLVGGDVPVTASDAALPDALEAIPDSAVLAALVQGSPAVAAAQAQLASAAAGERAARGAYAPTLSLSYNRNRTGPANEFTLSPTFGYVGSLRLGLSWTLFDQFGREQAVVAASVARDVAEAQLRDTRLAARQTLEQALAALRLARAQHATQSRAVAAGEEDLRVQEQRYQLGVATILDVLASQTTLAQARAGLVQARFNARVARAQLEALAGRLL